MSSHYPFFVTRLLEVPFRIPTLTLQLARPCADRILLLLSPLFHLPVMTSPRTPSQYVKAVDHMNADHSKDMASILEAHLNLSRPPTTIKMVHLDEDGFELEYTILTSFWSKPLVKGVAIPWREGKVQNAKDVRERLVKLTQESREELKGKPVPVIYSPPPSLPASILLVAALLYLSSSHSSMPGVLRSLQSTLNLKTWIPFVLKWTAVAHLIESTLLFGHILLQRKGGLGMALIWTLTHVIPGFPNYTNGFKVLNPTRGGGGKAKEKSH